MTTENYVRDERFEAHGAAIKIMERGSTEWYAGKDLLLMLDAIDWKNAALICHHAHFDGLILSHAYNIKPAFWFDTLSMARQIHGNHLSVSLASLAKHYKLEAKNVPYDLFKGKHWDELTPGEQRQVADGACHDIDLTWTIFQELMKSFPREELPIVDQTVRWFTEPKLVGDEVLFRKIAEDEALRKNEILYELGVGEKDLQSATKFVALLEQEGVEVEYKKGKPTEDHPEGKPIPAIAKTDRFMQELTDDANERIASLAAARLDVRSTLNETRAGRFAALSARGPACLYFAYCAAHTTRWGGGDKINPQNIPGKSGLRRGLRAPPGYLFIAPDQSQGECRLLNWLAGQEDVVQRFRNKEDPYLPMATAFFGYEVTKDMKDQRQAGKVGELQCGFGSGGYKVSRTAAKYGIEMSEADGDRLVSIYRATHCMVTRMWYAPYLEWLAARETFDWGPLRGEGGKLYGPNGGWIDYTSLKFDDESQEWRLWRRDGWSKLYGAKLVENVIQYLSRVVTSQCILRLRSAGIETVGMSHDDVWLIAKESEAEAVAKFACECMSVTPSWAPGLPLASEAKIGETYS